MSTEYDDHDDDGHDLPDDHHDGDGYIDDHDPDDGRALAVGVAGFVVVHLLALIVLDDPSLPALVVVEGLALAALVGGDAPTTRDAGATALVVVAVVVGLGAVGLALALGSTPLWVVALGLLVVGGGTLYVLHRYDRSVAGGAVT